jgi:hypothetical protein
MHDLIRYAFGRSDNGGSFHITGEPDWVDKDNYEVTAKVSPAFRNRLDAGFAEHVISFASSMLALRS